MTHTVTPALGKILSSRLAGVIQWAPSQSETVSHCPTYCIISLQNKTQFERSKEIHIYIKCKTNAIVHLKPWLPGKLVLAVPTESLCRHPRGSTPFWNITKPGLTTSAHQALASKSEGTNTFKYICSKNRYKKHPHNCWECTHNSSCDFSKTEKIALM